MNCKTQPTNHPRKRQEKTGKCHVKIRRTQVNGINARLELKLREPRRPFLSYAELDEVVPPLAFHGEGARHTEVKQRVGRPEGGHELISIKRGYRTILFSRCRHFKTTAVVLWRSFLAVDLLAVRTLFALQTARGTRYRGLQAPPEHIDVQLG